MSEIDLNEFVPASMTNVKTLRRIGYVTSVLAGVGAYTIVKKISKIVHRAS